MIFEKYNIAPVLKKALNEAGFKRPTDIQYKSIPSILEGEDVMAIAQTGTGKTAAFVIPILHILLSGNFEKDTEKEVKCLVMVPTRELAIQISKVFQLISKYTKLITVSITGGIDQATQEIELENGADIIVATPGRMFDLIYQKIIKITKVKILVLDEADRMLDMGFIKDIHDVKKFLPKNHQTLFFSATINPEIKELAYSIVKNPIRIQISPKERVSKNIQHSVAFIEMDDKRSFLERLVKEHSESRILVFVRTQVRAERVMKAMDRVGIKSITMHGGKEQKERQKALENFTKAHIKVLIATDVSARGIDVPNVEFVINYDVPDQVENYVHRIGRTGRGDAKGNAITFCSPEEKDMLGDIETFLDKKINIISMDSDEYQETLDLSEDQTKDWKTLINNSLLLDNHKKTKKKKK